MPLQSGKSREAIGHNVKTEEAAGKPKKQAVAIALHNAGITKSQDKVRPVGKDALPPGHVVKNDKLVGRVVKLSEGSYIAEKENGGSKKFKAYTEAHEWLTGGKASARDSVKPIKVRDGATKRFASTVVRRAKDVAKVEYIYAKKPAPVQPLRSITDPKDLEHMTGVKRTKDAAATSKATNLNSKVASLPKLLPVSNAKHVKYAKASANDSEYENNVAELVVRIKALVKKLRREGTTNMSERNLKQVINTRGLTLPNANAFERAFSEAVSKAGVGKFTNMNDSVRSVGDATFVHRNKFSAEKDVAALKEQGFNARMEEVPGVGWIVILLKNKKDAAPNKGGGAPVKGGAIQKPTVKGRDADVAALLSQYDKLSHRRGNLVSKIMRSPSMGRGSNVEPEITKAVKEADELLVQMQTIARQLPKGEAKKAGIRVQDSAVRPV